MSNFHHDQPRTLMDDGGHHARGQACDEPGSLARYLASGRRGHVRHKGAATALTPVTFYQPSAAGLFKEPEDDEGGGLLLACVLGVVGEWSGRSDA